MDEFAVYSNNLTASDVLAHYNTGISGSPNPTYFQLVTNDNPVIYLRMDNGAYTTLAVGTWPAVTNYGNAGMNGVYMAAGHDGIVPGPDSQAFDGLSGDTVAQFSGVSSFADVGYAPAFNPTGAMPFSVTAMFRGDPCDNRVQTIVGHSDNSWRITMNTSGTLQCQLGGMRAACSIQRVCTTMGTGIKWWKFTRRVRVLGPKAPTRSM